MQPSGFRTFHVEGPSSYVRGGFYADLRGIRGRAPTIEIAPPVQGDDSPTALLFLVAPLLPDPMIDGMCLIKVYNMATGMEYRNEADMTDWMFTVHYTIGPELLVNTLPTSLPPPLPPPPAPTLFDGYLDGMPYLTWTSVPGASSYRVERDGSPLFALILGTHYWDRNVGFGTHTYRVRGVGFGGEGAWSNLVSIRVPQFGAPIP